MEELYRHIKRDLFDIKENIKDPDAVMEIFSFSERDFENIIFELKNSVEDGLIEYKKTSVNQIIEHLKSLQYDSRAMNSLDRQIDKAGKLLAVTVIQRFITAGIVKTADRKEGKSPADEIAEDKSQPAPGINEIAGFIQSQLAEDQEKRNDPLFKKLIIHIKNYNSEVQKLKDLISRVPVDKQIAMKRNFTETSGKEVAKIKDIYNEIIKESLQQPVVRASGNILQRYDYSVLNSLLMEQIETFSRILSTLKYAVNERFKTRELLLQLTREQDKFLALITKEKKAYADIAPFDKNGAETVRTFAVKISEFLEKEKEWLKLHPAVNQK